MKHRLVIDAESLYDVGYSLRSMPACLYVRDPRWLCYGLGVKLDDAPAQWLTNAEIETFLDTIDWPNTRVVAHNLTGFDGLVLVEKYNRRAGQWTDTISLARTMLPANHPMDLDSVAAALGLGAKHKGVLESIKGVTNPTPEQLTAIGDYCIQDVELCAGIDDKLYPLIPDSERYIMSMTTRMGIDAVLRLDADVLEREITHQLTTRETKIENSGIDLTVLSSNQQFFGLLKTIIPEEDLPTKINKNGDTVPALAKGDAQWGALKAKYPEYQHIFDARENSKSNIRATRAKTFLEIARTPAGTLPAPYQYYAANTGRFAGIGKLGMMNLPSTRISRLREAVMAPEGHVLHIADSAQIELRVRLWLCDELTTLNELHAGRDLYIETAAAIFGVPIEAVTKHQRQVGKVTMLAAQFGMGWRRYQAYLSTGPMGMAPIRLSDAEAQAAIYKFRNANPMLTLTWDHMRVLLQHMINPVDLNWEFKQCRIRHEYIQLPNGLGIDYSNLRIQEDGAWVYGVGRDSYIHPGLLLENLCQALARVIVIDQIAYIDKHIAPCVMWVHDEGVFVAPEEGAEERQKEIEACMRVSPDWCPDLPLDADGTWNKRYLKD
jgi:hypothetical protein